MRKPPKDHFGYVKPHDHKEIKNDHQIIRKISKYFVVPDRKTGESRISSNAFKPSSGKNASLSVELLELILQNEIDAEEFLTTPRWFASLSLKVENVRGLGFQVGYQPTKENSYHGGVWGHFTKSKQKQLLKSSEWFVKIEGVSLK